MINEKDFLPQSLEECVIGDPRSRGLLSELVSNRLPVPAFGKCGILLHGPYGTGKSTTASLLPILMERARSAFDAHFTEHKCAQGTNGATLMTTIQQTTSFVSLNTSGLHYTVLDEVDNLTEAAQASLKAIMDSKHGAFILATNHLPEVNAGVVDRCHLIHMVAARPDDWLPLVRRVISAFGAQVPADSVLVPVIAQCAGSARAILAAAVSIASRSQTQGATV
ncbi:MAG: AAA family ATPase [Betaproteobacteria bacterium]